MEDISFAVMAEVTVTLDGPVLTVIGTAAVAVLGYIFRTGRRIGLLEGEAKIAHAKANTMWDFQRRRGKVEAINSGVVVHDDTLSLTPEWRKYFEPLREDIQAWYRSDGRQLHGNDLYIAIEDKFGDRLTQEICLPHKLHDAACLVASVLLCRETHMVGVRDKA